MMQRSCPPIRLRRLAALLVGVCASLLASEALLRTAYLSPGQYQPDPVLGVDRVPYSRVFVGREGGARLDFDRYGLNNDDAAWARPGFRIGVLGDSFTEAVEVPREQNWVSRLWAVLPEAVVLNLGRAALTPPQAVELHQRIAARERLDLLVYALSENDLEEVAATRDLGPDCRLPERPISWRLRATTAILGESALLSRLHLRARDWWRAWAASARPPAAAAPEGSGPPTDLAEAMAACLAPMAARQPLLLVVLPDGILPNNPVDLAAGERRREVARQAAARVGAVAVLDAWGAFGTDPLGDGRFVNGFTNHKMGAGHPNALGHARLAEMLAPELDELLRDEPDAVVLARSP